MAPFDNERVIKFDLKSLFLLFGLVFELMKSDYHVFDRRTALLPGFLFFLSNSSQTKLEYHSAGPWTKAIISVSLNWLGFIYQVLEKGVTVSCRDVLEAMWARYSKLVFCRKWLNKLRPLKLHLDKVSRAVHADIVLTRYALEHLV